MKYGPGAAERSWPVLSMQKRDEIGTPHEVCLTPVYRKESEKDD